MANIEFKRDPRDGELKIIECNARYTAAQELVTRSGIDMPYLVYCFLIKQKAMNDGSDASGIENTAVKQATVTRFKENLYYWYPKEDFKSFLTRSSLGELSLFQWLKSVAHFPLVLPCWSFNDPKPSIMALANTIRNRVNNHKS